MRNGILSLMVFAMLALAGVYASPVAAQCSGGGCGSGGCSGSGGCGSGGCPSGGCGGSAKKIGRVGQPNNGGAHRGGAAAIDPAGVPSFERPSTDAVESAAVEQRPIVVYFPGEGADESEFYGEELAKLSKEEALFIKVPYTEDREASPWTEESVVPTSRLLSDNPAREYDIPVGEAVVLVCEWHGNEYFRTNEKVKVPALEKMISKVTDEVEDANDKLQKYFDKAKAEYDEGDTGKALKYLLKNFDDGDGLVGLPAQEESIRLYHEIMDNARSKMEELVEAGDADGLKDLEKEVKKTPLEKEIEDAVSDLK